MFAIVSGAYNNKMSRVADSYSDTDMITLCWNARFIRENRDEREDGRHDETVNRA